MAKKIKIVNIITNIESNKKVITSIGKLYEVCANSKSSLIDNGLANVLEHYLAFWIPVCCEYYVLKRNIDTLSMKLKNDLKELFLLLYKRWLKEYDDKPVGLDIINAFNNKFPLNVKKEEFFSKNNAIANDNSKEHLRAFNVESVNRIPKKNMLIKLTFKDIHLRMGIEVKGENKFTFTILALEHKKTRNKS